MTGLSGCKSTEADGITVLPSSVTPPEGRVHPQWGWQLLSQGGHLGGVPGAWTLNTLVHGKGLIPSHLLHSEFLQGKGDGGKTTGRAVSLSDVRKVMVKLTWALLGALPEPTKASSLVLPFNLSAVGL